MFFRPRVIPAVLLAGAAAILSGCRPSSPAPAMQRDGLRIVTLAPNITEILFALGLGDRIVGATDGCDYPPEARALPRVGGFGIPNVEQILAAAPDLVIACGVEKPELLAALERAKIRVLDVQRERDLSSFSELFSAIREIGKVTGREPEAAALATHMQQELDAIAARLPAVDEKQRPRVFVEIESSPLMTAGAGSFLDELISRAGGRNVAHEIADAYPRIGAEKVVEWNPDLILVAHGKPGEAAERLARHIGWSQVTAVRERRIIDDVDADLLFRPGPRLVEGVKQLAARLASSPSVPRK